MRSKNLNYVLVGLFVIAMLAALIGSVVVIKGRARASDTYYVVLDNVADVKFGTQVRYEGFPVGQVETIAPVAQGARMRFRVHMSVEQGWRISADSVARIASTSFLAAKTIDIQSGSSDTALSPGETIRSAPPADVFSVMTEVAGEFSALNRDGAMPLIEQVTDLVVRLGGSLERDLSTLLTTLNALADTLEASAPVITASLETLAERLSGSAANLTQIFSSEHVETVGRVLENVENATGNFAAMSRDLEDTARNIDGLVAAVDALVQENQGNVDKTLTDARYALRAITQNIDAIIHNLDGTTRNMNEFSRLIRNNPGLLLDNRPHEEIQPAARADGASSG